MQYTDIATSGLPVDETLIMSTLPACSIPTLPQLVRYVDETQPHRVDTAHVQLELQTLEEAVILRKLSTTIALFFICTGLRLQQGHTNNG